MIKEILLDVDGVLGDFWERAFAVHDKPYDGTKVTGWDWHREAWGMDDNEFWSKLDGHEFWLDIKLYPWADEFYKELCKIARVTIATSPCNDDFCSAGKHMWLRKHFGLKPKESIIGGRKELMSRPGTILIDDSPANIEKFNDPKLGGLGVLFPQPWNSAGAVPGYDWKSILSFVKVMAGQG